MGANRHSPLHLFPANICTINHPPIPLQEDVLCVKVSSFSGQMKGHQAERIPSFSKLSICNG